MTAVRAPGGATRSTFGIRWAGGAVVRRPPTVWGSRTPTATRASTADRRCGPATTDPAGLPAGPVGQAGGVRRANCVLVQRPRQERAQVGQLIGHVPRLSSVMTARKVATARLVCDFTVPIEQPSTSAVSASLRSS